MSMLFLSFLMFSLSLLGLSFSNWLLFVLSMEFLLFIFIFMCFNYGLLSLSSSVIKYFILQTIGSIFIFLGGYGVLESAMFNTSLVMLYWTGLFLKLGLFPFHFWVVPVISYLPFYMIFLVSSVLKILPLYTLYLTFFYLYYIHFNLLLWVGMLSILFGMSLGLKAMTLRSMMGASSISQTGWFAVAVTVGHLLFYFSVYFYNLVLLMVSLLYKQYLMSSFLLLSLGGLPPFSLFFAKLMVLTEVWVSGIGLILMVGMLVSSVFSLFYYMKYSQLLFMNKSVNKFKMSFMFLFLGNLAGVLSI
uniref:NADH-ubiquinone oxidoreductase chain 2 n=1 Tax=Polygyra cereolus TaxID=339438 RepID=A0A1J0MRQ0_9EUPU|nr:NADH dehydrogenase subunit 2 [Polygyra cereolus]APD28050.1 NADH dehydrogenase subunit 2 [Polygyra cereolus]